MEPDPDRLPDLLRKPPAGAPREEADVGDFRQGSPLSQWALGRYLVGRAIAESVGTALMLMALVLLGVAALAEWVAHLTTLAVLVVIVAACVLVLRAVLLGLVRRLTGFRQFASVEERMQSLVDDTSADVLRELRRIGLPGRVFTLPLLAFRFLGHKRRADTVARLRTFETERAVPKARLDELHLLLRQEFGSGVEP